MTKTGPQVYVPGGGIKSYRYSASRPFIRSIAHILLENLGRPSSSNSTKFTVLFMPALRTAIFNSINSESMHDGSYFWKWATAIPAARLGNLSEPLFGTLVADHVQLVPQSMGQLTEETAAAIAARYPNTRFRLHANVRVTRQHAFADLANLRAQQSWFDQAARVSKRLAAAAYTAHAGRRRDATLQTMLDNTRRVAELFDCPVGVEGQYPTKGNEWLVASWSEYQQLFESGVPYAVDLSHLNILATQSRRLEQTLVAEMLACERCLEVHVSANDGRRDSHQICEQPPWWFALLAHIHPSAVIFSEGNHRRTRRHCH